MRKYIHSGQQSHFLLIHLPNLQLLPGIPAPKSIMRRILRPLPTQLDDLFWRPILNLKEMDVLRRLASLDVHKLLKVNTCEFLSSLEDEKPCPENVPHHLWPSVVTRRHPSSSVAVSSNPVKNPSILQIIIVVVEDDGPVTLKTRVQCREGPWMF